MDGRDGIQSRLIFDTPHPPYMDSNTPNLLWGKSSENPSPAG